MNHNTALGLLFPNMHDEALPELTAVRAMGSVPFGGRYRLVDFALSNLVNAGVCKVGVLTKNNYQSLMDHLGSGKAWDLSRKTRGLYFLPPFGAGEEGYSGRLSSLSGIRCFLESCREEYVILSDCHVVANIDLKKMLHAHVENRADITVAYLVGTLPKSLLSPVLHVSSNGHITDIHITNRCNDTVCYGIGLYVIARTLLLQLVETAVSRNRLRFEWDILQRHLGDLQLFGYRVTEWARVISSLDTYFDANMSLLDPVVRKELFLSRRPIYTKVRDCSPAVYGLHAGVTDSLIADGCRVDGAVEHSILFRDVSVGKHCHVQNCLLLQGGIIGTGSRLDCVITDKNVCLRENRSLQGCQGYPVSVRKGSVL